MQSPAPSDCADVDQVTVADPKEGAELAGLIYVQDDRPGISREPKGEGFRYRDPDGKLIREEETLQRIGSLAIPPAYTDVWICLAPDGHVQAHFDDAEQCCAIAVHRAIQAYDPEKAQFTTFVNWQIRGELQGLRFRLMTDQRPSAKKVKATTISLHSVATGPEGEEITLETAIIDEDALLLTESAASDYLAKSATASLLDEFVRNGRAAGIDALRRQQPKRALARARAEGPRLKSTGIGLDAAKIADLEHKLARDREILECRVFGDGDATQIEAGVSNERVRQIGKRAARIMAELALTQSRFQLMADYATTATSSAPVGLLPSPDTDANRTVRVTAAPRYRTGGNHARTATASASFSPASNVFWCRGSELVCGRLPAPQTTCCSAQAGRERTGSSRVRPSGKRTRIVVVSTVRFDQAAT